MLPGNDLMQADADMACCQTTFKGTPTYVRIPQYRWKGTKLEGMKDPVCRMTLALYGHPESGYYWEEHCDLKLQSEGFEPVEEWPGCYWHPKYSAMVIVYVDDFKVAAPKQHMAKIWDLVREPGKQPGIRIDDPTAPAMFLGCRHRLTEVNCKDAPGGKIRLMEYDMQNQLQSAIDLSLIHI